MTSSVSNISSGSLLILKALQFRGVGPAAVRRFAKALPSNPQIPLIDALEQVAPTMSKDSSADSIAQREADEIVRDCERLSIKILSLLDDQYPTKLREIKDAPPVIYVKGNIDTLVLGCCAVVGTRNASNVGLRLAHRIAELVSEFKLVTVSGLALGIDTAAHEGALEAHGKTIAILAHGLDKVAPASNKKLADEILSAGGALISEHPPGVPPRPAEFVRRNRIQSGMSFCSIIVESGKVGGAIHQARFTKEQGRKVFVVWPEASNGKVLEFNSEGADFLSKTEGASVLRSAEQLREYLKFLSVNPISEEQPVQSSFIFLSS